MTSSISADQVPGLHWASSKESNSNFPTPTSGGHKHSKELCIRAQFQVYHSETKHLVEIEGLITKAEITDIVSRMAPALGRNLYIAGVPPHFGSTSSSLGVRLRHICPPEENAVRFICEIQEWPSLHDQGTVSTAHLPTLVGIAISRSEHGGRLLELSQYQANFYALVRWSHFWPVSLPTESWALMQT
jgi:hypothetical protein